MNRKSRIAIAVASVFAASAAFATSPSTAFAETPSRKVVQIGDDVVVIGLVPAPGSSVADNIAISRFTADGEPLSWTQRTSWTDAEGTSIVFPGSAWHFTAVRDVQVFKDHLWILVDSTSTDENGQVSAKSDVLAFDSKGQFKGGRFAVVPASASGDVSGAGMLFQSASNGNDADKLLVAAGCADASAGAADRLCVHRYLLSTENHWYPTIANDGANESATWTLKTADATR